MFSDKGNIFITVKGSDACSILNFKTMRVKEFRPLETNRELFLQSLLQKGLFKRR